MSAYLDKSQGITFVYSNIFDLYRKAKEAKLDEPFVAQAPTPRAAPAPLHAVTEAPAARVIKESDAKVESYEPRELDPGTERPYAVPMGVREAEEKAKRLGQRPLASLQKNLSDLTDAHDKLRFLLKELETLTKKK